MSAIYIACAFPEREVARHYAAIVRRLGHVVTSSWLGVVETSDDELTEEQRAAAWQACLADISRSDLLLALPCYGTPRATLVEVGVAQALGKATVWVHSGRRGLCIAAWHPKVVRVDVGSAPRVSGLDRWAKATLQTAFREAVGR